MSKSLGNVDRAAGRHEAERRRHPAAVGRRLRLRRGSAHRPRDPEAYGRRLSPAAQHAALSARRARRVHAGRDACRAAEMPELERWVLHRLAELDAHRAAARSPITTSTAMFTALHNFCAVDLSAFYFDIRKDRLYCDARRRRRRGARRGPCWTAPSTAWRAGWRRCCASPPRKPGSRGTAMRRSAASISNCFPRCRRAGTTRRSAARWAELRDLRRVVTGALEVERAAKAHRLEPAGRGRDLRAGPAAARCCARSISPSCASPRRERCAPARRRRAPSPCRMCPASASSSASPTATRCERCWRVLPEVGRVPGHDDLCRRCADVVDRGAVSLAAVAG